MRREGLIPAPVNLGDAREHLLSNGRQGRQPPMSDDGFFTLRDRAYELAETGRFKAWGQVADALQAEGFLPTLITRLDSDGLAVMMITRCCGQARA